MELAGKYMGPSVNMSKTPMARAIDALVQKGYSFEDAFGKVMLEHYHPELAALYKENK
jgi:hypothetical protein